MDPMEQDLTQDAAYNAALGSQMMDPPMEEQEPVEKVDTTALVDGEIRSMILKRKEASRVWRHEKKLIWDKCWNHYKQVYDKTNKENWQSTTFIPASPKVAEVIISNMHSALLAPDKPVEYQARQPIYEELVRDANDLIAVDCDRSEFKVHWTDILRTLGVIGTGLGKVEYIKESALVSIKERVKAIPGMDMMRRMIGLPPAPTETTTQKRMLVKDFAATRNVDPYNFYPEPGSVEITKDNWCIEEGKICNYKLIELMQDPDNPLRNISPDVLSSGPATVNDNSDKQEKDAVLDEPIKTSAYMDPDQEHKLDEYWGPAPVWMVQPELWGKEEHKYEMVNAWFWLIDGIHVVRAQVTPFRDAEPPYVKGVYIRVPGQFWGIGPLELMLGLQVELNELRNTRQDNVNIMLNKVIAVLKSAIDSGDYARLVSGPGAVWLFNNIDDVKKALMPIDFPDVTQDSWRSSGEVYNEIQEVTAANKATVGTGGGADQAGGDTFRGQLLNKQVASERFIMYARIMEITGLGKAYRKMYHRIYQFKDWKAAEEMLGEKRAAKFQFVAPEDLDLMARLVPLGVTTMENKGVKLAQKAEEFKMFMGQPWFKAVEAARAMVTIGGDIPDQTIMTDEEISVLNEMKREAYKQMGEIGGPMPGEAPMGGGPSGPPSGPIAGNVPGPTDGMPMPAMAARGPGASSIDVTGRPAA
jgi:hypothetical protein